MALKRAARKIMGSAVLLGIVGVIMLLGGCSGGHTAAETSDSLQGEHLDSLQSEHDISADARQWSDSILATMTIEEMAGQLIMPAVFSDAGKPNLKLIRQYVTDCHVGGLVLLKGSIPDATMIADTLRSLMRIPAFIAIDAEWGLSMRLEGAPEFPRNGRISPTADEEDMFDYGAELARECREIGINMVLGPVLDVLPDVGTGSGIGSRSFGSDPKRVAELGVAYSKGVESGGVISVAKHFPGHGSADADSHKRLPVVGSTRQQLESHDLLPFRDYISNGMSGLMAGHLFVPALDEKAVPVTVSEKILTEFLRQELGFEGLIVTDAINMAGADGYTAADAIMAGADIVLAPSDTKAEISGIIDAIRSSRMPIGTLRDRVRRVLFYKYMSARGKKETGKIDLSDEAERIIKLLR